MNVERFETLSMLDSLGALSEAEAEELRRLRSEATPDQLGAVSAFGEVASMMGAFHHPVRQPPASLKARVMSKIAERKNPDPASVDSSSGLSFMRGADKDGWLPMKVAGAFVKPLSIDKERGIAVVLGKLEPGTHYPAHYHPGPEDIYVISGDLSIGAEKLEAGDFHHAEAGSRHEENTSVAGCVIFSVISLQNLAEHMP